MSLDYESFDCVVQCYDNEENEQHFAPLDESSGATHEYGGGDHTTNIEGLCTEEWGDPPQAGKHRRCGGNGFLASVARDLRNAIAANDVAKLASIWASAPPEAYVAPERRAIQMLDCYGEVAIHLQIPVSALGQLQQVTRNVNSAAGE